MSDGIKISLFQYHDVTPGHNFLALIFQRIKTVTMCMPRTCYLHNTFFQAGSLVA